MAKIAWIGVGVMGKAMAKRLAEAGHELTLYNRTAAKAKEAAELMGAKACDTIEEAVRDRDYIFVMVGYPQDVAEVMRGEAGIFANAPQGSLIIDMTTSSPELARELSQEAAAKGLRLMDAPVSGGDKGAREGTLSIMAGGSEEDFEEARPLFSVLGKNLNYMGPAGCGQHTKAANQIAVAGATAAYTEVIVYARKVGMDPAQIFQAIATGAAGSWQIDNMAPRALREDFAPGFFVKHFIKDMRIVHEEMEKRDTKLEMLETVLAMYEEFSKEGHADDGTQALVELY
ncbi:MAG: NAD(P)-dependent oxidoreductase [Eubacteriales bacterium]|nr:NAD(P)-dependent oxidoreductase [Eubacteriales bacterium]